jgi:hypothetical protein
MSDFHACLSSVLHTSLQRCLDCYLTVVEFHILRHLSDKNPIIVRRKRRLMDVVLVSDPHVSGTR